jgi:hypothetical protein
MTAIYIPFLFVLCWISSCYIDQAILDFTMYLSWPWSPDPPALASQVL